MTSSLPRHVTFVTTSRADFGHLQWPIHAVNAHPQLRASLVVIGAHLSPEFGHTVDAIREAGCSIDAEIECLLSSDTGIGMAKTIGLATLGLADALDRLNPDIVFIPADRYEMLAVASAALALRCPIAHLEGGDISAGAIDDAVRNAITKMAHLHFTTTENARRRVIAMGEEDWRVHWVGTPSLDHLAKRTPLSDAELHEALGVELPERFLLVAFHPVTLTQSTDAQADALYAALDSCDDAVVFCFPNSDADGRRLIERSERFCAGRKNAHLFVNLEHWVYWNVLMRCTVLLGNSSSGIMEAPAVRKPVIDIGERQKGRLCADNTIRVAANTGAIAQAIERVTTTEFQRKLEAIENPYGDGRASDRIAELIAGAPDRDRLLMKQALPLEASRWGTVGSGAS
ncbi:MAG: UDP-N-acetylglucosamine 2-epimerase [Pseudomonadota bacterium]